MHQSLWGAKSMMINFGENVAQCVLGAVQPRVSRTDSALALSYALVHSGEIRIEKRKGEDNTADIGSKAVTAPVLRKHLKTLEMEWRDG